MITDKMNDLEKGVYAKYVHTFPFPVVEFADEIGLKLFTDSDMPQSQSGVIQCEGGECKVVLNANMSINRLRFTLAHELGHYFNDRDYLQNNGEIIEETKQSTRKLFRNDTPHNDPIMRRMDIEANKFAADLLMPEVEFIKKWQESTSPQQVADYFGVSVDSVRVRASYLLGEII